ncbi:MAG: TolC family protein [Pseudomonadota bacterium]
MRLAVRKAVVLCVLALNRSAWAQAASPVLPTDATLTKLIADSLTARPEVAQAKAVAHANQERVSQVGALPDPMLQIGIQNDGFRSIEIGRMDTSFLSVMASQTFPWPGKLQLREDAAKLGASQTLKAVARLQLSTEADVRREYLDLVLVRDRLVLLDQLEVIWRRSRDVAQSRYATGAQSDVLRAQLELNRIEQRRFALQAREQSRAQALNRLSVHPLADAIDTSATHVRDLAVLAPLERVFSSQHALARSPELAAARLGTTRANNALSLAEKSYYPDLTVSAGIMYRGQLPAMWLATVAGPLPIFAGAKQNRAVAENEAWLGAAKNEVSALEQLLLLRSEERRVAFSSLRKEVALYQQALLVQSAATSESTLAQYAVGKLPFASVLEANAGYIADQEAYLETVAAAHRLLIAEVEVSLAASPMPLEAANSSAMTTTGNGQSEASPSSM